MKELLLHVGHGKTGSSYIQSSLALSQSLLEKNGIFYPETNSMSKARLGRITSGNGVLLKTIKPDDYNGSRVLLSSEVIFHEILNGSIDPFFERLESSGVQSVKILLFIRNPLEHAASAYQQLIKRGGGVASVEEYFSRYRHPELVAEFIKYCKKYSNIKLTIKNYTVCKKNIIDEFEKWLGCGSGMLQEPPFENVNRSMTRSELRFQKALNTVLGESGNLVSDELCNTLPDIQSETVLPGEKEQEAMLSRLSQACQYVDGFVAPEYRYQVDVIPVDKDKVSYNHYDFTGEQIDVISTSLGKEIQKAKKGSANSLGKTLSSPGNDDGAPLLKAIRARFNRDPADVLREMALCFESGGDIKSAYFLMSHALSARPRGEFIKKKTIKYHEFLFGGEKFNE